eukprot:TRINITY_DN11606_c0_g1_i1.p1 TRINITY_DN11606_c0_g1~~TRINITY_DN11606_c0_g1_i1.p1  ORF type:complete len:436 (-),score=67.92 TRINITY_DN11606_c0_g1_i1:416-1546(-)
MQDGLRIESILRSSSDPSSSPPSSDPPASAPSPPTSSLLNDLAADVASLLDASWRTPYAVGVELAPLLAEYSLLARAIEVSLSKTAPWWDSDRFSLSLFPKEGSNLAWDDGLNDVRALFQHQTDPSGHAINGAIGSESLLHPEPVFTGNGNDSTSEPLGDFLPLQSDADRAWFISWRGKSTSSSGSGTASGSGSGTLVGGTRSSSSGSGTTADSVTASSVTGTGSGAPGAGQGVPDAVPVSEILDYLGAPTWSGSLLRTTHRSVLQKVVLPDFLERAMRTLGKELQWVTERVPGETARLRWGSSTEGIGGPGSTDFLHGSYSEVEEETWAEADDGSDISDEGTGQWQECEEEEEVILSMWARNLQALFSLPDFQVE